MKKITAKIKVLIISLALIIGAGFFYSFDNNNFEISKNLEIFHTLFTELNMYYVDETDPGELLNKGIIEMLKSLDPYTNYFPESRIEEYKLMTKGQYGGIGALIRKSGEYIMISEPYEGYPAQRAGLIAGDLIVAVGDKSTKGIKSTDISELLKGQPNTELKLTIKRYGEKENFEITLERENIKLKNVPYSGMVADSIGYIRLSSFTEGAGRSVKEAFLSLKDSLGLKGIILDLRGNPGGLLMEAVHISNIFVEKGQEIVSTKGKISQWNNTYKALHQATDKEIPVAVLVNSGSASASEIVSGAIQDLDRGVVIGSRTFGKGLVQTTRKLSYNSQLKVTVAKYYIPSGRCIQALDYTHRKEDGSVGKIPDSLITEFTTVNGRKVYDGGGVQPDIEKNLEKLSKIAISLSIKNMIFNYVTKYCTEHDSVASINDIVFTDEDYKDFTNYLNDKEFDYVTNSEEKLKELEKIAEKEKYLEIAEEDFKSLREKLAHDKDKDLQVFKDEIVQLIKEEIAGRYFYQNGKIELLIQNDEVVDRAIEVLNNKDEYNNILSGGVLD